MSNSSTLELNLFPFSNCDPDLRHQPPPPTVPQQQQQQQQKTAQPLTIFYNGNVCITDVTELQAKAILLLARREEEMARSPSSSSETLESPPLKAICNANGLSMKKSLQRFLQKRNNRIQSTFPYTISRPLKSCSLRR